MEGRTESAPGGAKDLEYKDSGGQVAEHATESPAVGPAPADFVPIPEGTALEIAAVIEAGVPGVITLWGVALNNKCWLRRHESAVPNCVTVEVALALTSENRDEMLRVARQFGGELRRIKIYDFPDDD